MAWQPCVEVALNSPSVELEEASQPGWDDLQAIADAPTKVERRRLAGDLKAKSENGSLTGLQTDRLLVQGSGNLWCLAPSFIADLLARDHVRELLAQSEVAGWASL